ncbi:MAG: cation:proton antiporter, partial [Bacteroidota bacterium]|nr:cation:proton antiporter [Bacteroidota bacterium]
AEGNLNSMFWLRLGISLLIFSLIVFWLFPIITRWFFKNVEGENSMQYIFVLALVFLSGFLAEVAGIEPIIGAFMAGLSLNRLIPHTSPLMNRIEFVGNTIFIPFFLLGVGMLVDMRVVLQGPEALIVAGTLTAVAVVGKWFGAYFTQKIFKYSANQRKLLFGLSSAHAAATLAVILIGFNLGLVDVNVLNGTILLILATCLISSFVTENAGRKIAVEESDKMLVLNETLERILVPIANPSTIERLMDLAIMIKDPNSKEPIFPLAVVKDDDEAKEKVYNSVRMLEKAIVHASATDNQVQILTRVDLNIASGIIRAIKELMITDLVIGWSEKLKSTDRLFGTSLDKILHHTDTLTMVCKVKNPLNTIRRIIILVPENADLEGGFQQWVNKIKIISKQSGADLTFHGTATCLKKLDELVSKTKPDVSAKYNELKDWSNYLEIAEDLKEDDLFIIVSARRGTISFQNNMENLPFKLAKNFSDISFIVLYPHQNIQVNTSGDFYQSQEIMYNSYINNTAKQKKKSLEKELHDPGRLNKLGDQQE